MTEDALNEAIYQRYIKPTDRERTRKVGLEFELPILNKDSEPPMPEVTGFWEPEGSV